MNIQAYLGLSWLSEVLEVVVANEMQDKITRTNQHSVGRTKTYNYGYN